MYYHKLMGEGDILSVTHATRNIITTVKNNKCFTKLSRS